MIDRKSILAQDRARKAARGQVIGRLQQTRQDMRPANLLNRWKLRQLRQIAKVTATGARFAKKNRLIIGGAALAALAITLRRPLIAAAKKLHDKYRQR